MDHYKIPLFDESGGPGNKRVGYWIIVLANDEDHAKELALVYLKKMLGDPEPMRKLTLAIELY